MQIFGPPLVRPMPYDLSKILKDIKDMVNMDKVMMIRVFFPNMLCQGYFGSLQVCTCDPT